MRAGRWTGVAVGALALAIVPGALQLLPERTGIERVSPTPMGMAEAAPAPSMAPPSQPEEPIIPPDDGLTGELAPVVPAPAPYVAARRGGPGDVFALVVGINDYPGSRSDLRAAVADADTVDAALSGFGVPAANRVVLRDGQARRGQLVASIRALVATAGSGSTVVFAYAGHVRKLGRSTEAIVAADGGLLRDDELAALLAPLTTQSVWLLMASCYAGGFTEALAPGRILTAAADANSLAYESPALNGSYLVHHMVREGWLEGRAGSSVQEAFAYAQARINELYPNR
ncbi:MAG: caspase family protein, partial [Acidimicrobiales bacterium]